MKEIQQTDQHDSLKGKEKLQLAIQTGLQLIPYIGAAASTAYFGFQQEKRIKRIETFYIEIAAEIHSISDKIAKFEDHNENELMTILEDFNEKIEKQYIEKKVDYFKQYFKNTLISPVNGNFDKRIFFLDVLYRMTTLEADLLIFFCSDIHNKFLSAKDIPLGSTGIFEKKGALERLINYGFLDSYTIVPTTTGNIVINNEAQKYKISEFGIEFFHFCLNR